MSSFDESLYYEEGEVIPAEHYVACEGAVHLAPLTDDKGILELYDLRKQCSVDYQIEISADGEYTLEIRYNSYRDAEISFSSRNGRQAFILPNTQRTWKTERFDINLPQGKQTIRIESMTEVSPKYNWFRIIN